MNRKTLLSALTCALGIVCGSCGSSSHLESIQLTTASSALEGFDVIGLGGTLQLVATGTYSNGRTVNLTNKVKFDLLKITPDSVDQNGVALPVPPQGLALGPTGLLTAQYPGVCTWVNLNAASTTATVPAWKMVGSYTVTATAYGVPSPPVYVAVASEVGIVDSSNPTGACGPQPASSSNQNQNQKKSGLPQHP